MEEILKILEVVTNDMVRMTHVVESLIKRCKEMEMRINVLESKNRNNGNKFTDDEGLEPVRV